MKKILLLGNSHIACIKNAITKIGITKFKNKIEIAGMWQGGFKYLYLNGSFIEAPSFTPKEWNKKQINLKDFWRVGRIFNQGEVDSSLISNNTILPDLDEYDRIIIFASPSRLFSMLYYENSKKPNINLFSELVISKIARNLYISKEISLINQNHLSTSPIILDIAKKFSSKVIFVGSPLPIEGKFKNLEKLKKIINSDSSLLKKHLENIQRIRFACRSTFDSTYKGIKVVLPPPKLLTKCQIATLQKYSWNNKDIFHTNTHYGEFVLDQLGGILDL